MPERSLQAQQRSFAGWVTALGRNWAGLSSEAAVEAWIRAGRGIPAHERLRVYANAYLARIESVLREDFGALSAALGEGGFGDLVRLYLMAHPPCGYSIGRVGERLPSFLREPATEAFRRRFPFAADLAALEWAITDVFDERDADLLASDVLARLPAEAWAELHLELVPAQRVLELAWPVQRIRDAWSAASDLPALTSVPTTLLVWRHAEAVYQRALPPDEAHALACVRRGDDFGGLCEEIAAFDPRADAAPRMLEMLRRWLADGLISAAAGAESRRQK